MLEEVRSWLQSEATQILIALLTVIFMVYFGMPQQSCSGGARGQRNVLMAEVGGTSIYSNDLNLIYNRAFGTDNRGDDEGQLVQRKARALRAIVLIELFADRAYEMGLRVSDGEFKEYIKDPHRNMEYRFFYGRSGEWNGPYYKAYVQNQLRATIPQYENFKRRELLARKYLVLQSSQVAVPPYELAQGHEIANTKLNLEFIAFDKKKLQEYVSVSDEEVETFMEKQSGEIQSYYDEHKADKYTEPERVRVRRIFIPKPSQSADESAKQEKRAKWKKAKERVLEKGESLGDVAAEVNPSFSAEKKGLMDWTTLDNLDQNITEAIEGKDVGVTDTIVTKHAWMLVKLEDRKKAEETPLSEVRGEIAKTLLRQQKLDDLMASASKTLQKAAESAESLSAALETVQKNSDKTIWKGLSVQETGEFTLEGRQVPAQLRGRLSGMNIGGSSWANIPKIGTSQKLAAAAFKKLSPSNPVPDELYTIDGTDYIVRLKERTSSSSDSSDGKSGDEAKEKDEGPGIESIMRQRGKRRSEILGRWSGIFQMPQASYGPWIEKQLEQAIDGGSVALYDGRSAVAKQVAESFKPAGDTEAASSPMQKLKKKLKIKGQGKGGKTIKIDPSKGEGGGSESGGEGNPSGGSGNE